MLLPFCFSDWLSPIARVRAIQAEVLAQRRAGILLVEQPAALQFRNDHAAEFLIGARHMRLLNHEPVARSAGEPFLHAVRHLLRAADETRMIVKRAPASDVDEVAR